MTVSFYRREDDKFIDETRVRGFMMSGSKWYWLEYIEAEDGSYPHGERFKKWSTEDYELLYISE